ncbi:hypothetical protein D3C71_1392960 [compost metagenome]
MREFRNERAATRPENNAKDASLFPDPFQQVNRVRYLLSGKTIPGFYRVSSPFPETLFLGVNRQKAAPAVIPAAYKEKVPE